MVEMRGVEPLRIAYLAGSFRACVQIRVRIFFVLQKNLKKPIDIAPIGCYNKTVR